MPSGEGGGSSAVASSSSVQAAGGEGRRSRRSSSVVVYPEDDDTGKPKVFARQSFVVSGEEETMAETILRARQLAGERRRSTFVVTENTVKEGEIMNVAQNLAARRESLQPKSSQNVAATTAPSTSSDVTTSTTAATKVGGGGELAEAARRRSSVMKLPDNLRALVQQSDASGVQQKTEKPYIPQEKAGGDQDQDKTADTTPGTSSLNNTSSSTASNGNTSRGWLSNALTFIRWKRLPGGKKRNGGQSGDGKQQERGGGNTAASSPLPWRNSSKNRSLLPKQPPNLAGRKLLVLDLDETLVHSSFKPVPGADFIIDIMVDNTFYKVFVLKRPGVDEFLERVAKLYEVVIFTASLPQYANPLLDLLDPKGTITSRLFREHCTFHEGYFVKDLTLLRHETLESTIIVDNSPMAYMFQPENAIDCLSWIDEMDDTELGVIADFLEVTVDVPDVRDLLEFWREGAAVLEHA